MVLESMASGLIYGGLIYELRAVHCRVDESPVRRWLGGLCSCTGGEASSSSRLGLWNTSSPLGVIDFFLADEKIASMHAEGSSQRRGLVAMLVAMPTSPVSVERGGTIYELQYTLRCAKCHCRRKYIR